jgi:hypothetical protein
LVIVMSPACRPSPQDGQSLDAFDFSARRGLAAEAMAERLDIAINSVHQAKSRVLKAIQEAVERIRAEGGIKIRRDRVHG